MSYESLFTQAKLVSGTTGAWNNVWFDALGKYGFTESTLPERMKAWAEEMTGQTGALPDLLKFIADENEFGTWNELSDIQYSFPLKDRLNPLWGIGTYNFTSDAQGDSTLIPYDDGVVDCKAHEARFTGARRVENLVVSSIMTVANGWITSAHPPASVVENLPDALGGNTAVRYERDGSGAGDVFQISSGAISFTGEITNSVYIKTTQENLDRAGFYVEVHDGSIDDLNWVDVTSSLVADTWVRVCSAIGDVVTTQRGLSVRFGETDLTADGSTIEVCYPQAEDVTNRANKNPSEYVSVGVATNDIEINGDSEFNNAGYWTDTGTGWTVSGGVATNDGTAGTLYHNGDVVTGQTYLVTAKLSDYTSGTANIYVGGALALSLTDTNEAKAVVTATSVQIATIAGGVSLFSVDYIRVRRIDHGSNVDGVKYFAYTNPWEVTGNIATPTATVTALTGLKGVLPEPSRTNQIQYSEDFTIGWVESGLAPIAASTRTIAGIPAFKFVSNNVGSVPHEAYDPQWGSLAQGNYATLSAYFDKGDGNATHGYLLTWGGTDWVGCSVNLTTFAVQEMTAGAGRGNVDSSVVAGTILAEQEADGVRLSFVVIGNSVSSARYTDVGFTDNANSPQTVYANPEDLGYATGAQFEAGSFVTTYIPATGSPVTRTADVSRYPHENLPKDASSIVNDICITGTITLDFDATHHSTTVYVLETGANSIAQERLVIYLTTLGYLTFGTTTGGTFLNIIGNAPLVAGEYKYLVRLSSVSGMSMFINGVKQTITQPSRTQGINYSVNPFDIFIGSNISATSHCGHPQKDIKIYGKDLSDAKCVELTS